MEPVVIRTADVSALNVEEVPDDSVDLVFTDPPYAEADRELFGELGKLAARVLRPGGLCLAYSGVMFLNDVLRLLGDHLEYVWTFGLSHSGGRRTIWKYRLWNAWKPIVVFGKPPVDRMGGDFDFACDWIRGSGRQKGAHPWQQGFGEACYLIEKLTSPGDLLLDPFVGGGTIPAACRVLGRGCVGFDVDEATVEVAQRRVAELLPFP